MKAQGKQKVRPQEKSPEIVRQSVTSGLKSVGSDVMKGFWEDFFKSSVKQMPQPFLPGGLSGTQGGGELRAGQEFNLKKQDSKGNLPAGRQEAPMPRSEAHVDYFRRIEKTDILADQRENQIVSQRVEEIRVEIKQLMQASKQMEMVFRDVTRDQAPVKVGKYHLTFFDWVLGLLRNARAKIEDGANWTQMFKSKKKQKQYWGMFKKHGTSFGLSSERTLATQTG